MTIIRQATIDDSIRITPLWINSMEFHSDHHIIFKTAVGFKEKITDDIKHLINNPEVKLFVAEQDNEIAGFSLTTISTRPIVFEKRKRGYIGDSYVVEKLRGQGIGTLLISTIKKWFKEQKVDFIDLQVTKTNDRGTKFWEKSGFKLVNYYMVHDLTK